MTQLTDPRRAAVRRLVGAAVVVALVALGVAVFTVAVTPGGGTSVLPAAEAASAATYRTRDSALEGVGAAYDEEAPVVYVHVLGAVNAPGLYRLQPGDRAVDAIAAAGGFAAEADFGAVNLARPVVDGEQLRVLTAAEAKAQPAAPAVGSASAGTGGAVVNVNTATATELEALPRIGPALAARIIEWRERHGRFRTVDDLIAVSGIGEKLLDGLRDLVTV
ncbi:ComEA family DNA-binding protein [Ruicaihuangia caeni]|uniref:ComEA family DNA-binding protein n=1 Tax=Ruicaihuangia caeni TaxID=3042517 RepID=UPI00338EEDC5